MKNKILYVYHTQPNTFNIQSGRPASIYNRMIEEYEVHFLNYTDTFFFVLSKAEKIFGKLFNKDCMTGRGRLSRMWIYLRIKIYLKLNKFTNTDIIFTPTSACISSNWSKLKLKVVCCVDSLILGIAQLYPNYNFANLDADIASEINALSGIDVLFVPSEWAKQQALYLGFRGVVSVAPFGHNLPIPIKLKHYKQKTDIKKVRFLSVMADWNRKGGDLLLELGNKLVCFGYDIDFIIIGECKNRPQLRDKNFKITFLGALDKSNSNEWAKFDNEFRLADIFIMPSKGEAYGMSIPEALHYGLPTIASSHGGIAIFNDLSSKCVMNLNSSEDVENVAIWVDSLITSQDRITEAIDEARALSEVLFNWDIWFKNFRLILEEDSS
ncbi:glycosyltransferase [Gammaproteobacteria bacterium]|nr:glycosyltransferase [Gammaproteobacteria bacterium]